MLATGPMHADGVKILTSSTVKSCTHSLRNTLRVKSATPRFIIPKRGCSIIATFSTTGTDPTLFLVLYGMPGLLFVAEFACLAEAFGRRFPLLFLIWGYVWSRPKRCFAQHEEVNIRCIALPLSEFTRMYSWPQLIGSNKWKIRSGITDGHYGIHPSSSGGSYFAHPFLTFKSKYLRVTQCCVRSVGDISNQ